MHQNTQAFAAYVPMDRRQALASGATLGHRATGSVLFADISGFTPLTSALYENLGPQRGAEELDRTLNRVFEALIDCIHRFRGSAIGFSGDAVICWFDGDDGLWATACALQMQQQLDAFGSIVLADGALTLEIKASVATGTVRRLVVGDDQVQLIDVIAGDPVERVAEGEQMARPGEVIVCSGVHQNIQGRIGGGERRTAVSGREYFLVNELFSPVEGRPWLDIPANLLDKLQMKPWIPPTVYERLDTGHGQFLAELRNSVALFLRFSGLDYDSDPDVETKLDGFVRYVQQTTAHYGGTLVNLTIGDKGSYLLCSFGAPIAHEDDPRRAAAAALDLHNLPAELGYIRDLAIGISQGVMFSGAYGGTKRRTFGILGEDTNLAARLMGRAKPGQVLVTSHVAATARKSHELQELAPVEVKGFAEPIPVYRLLGTAVRRGRAGVSQSGSEMVGRSAEKHLLEEHLDALQKLDSSAVIVIEGEAGIGKSRLLEELLQQAQAQGITAFLGAGDAIEKSAAYHAWRAIFWDFFGLDHVDDAEPPGAGRLSTGQRALVLDRLQNSVPDRQQLAPLINAVLPTDLPDNELTAQMSGEVRAGNTQDLLVELLKAEAEPLLVVLEDAHWLDSASWDLARLASRDVAPLLLVLATRPLPDPLPVEYTALLRRAKTEHILLDTLPPEESLQLVQQRLGVVGLPPAVSALLLDKAGGHPFFTEELAYALRDNGMLVIEGGEARLADGEAELDALAFPDSIDSVITSRIDLLTSAQQLTLKVASVIGRVFAFRTLRDIHPVAGDKPQLHQQLDTLERLDITPLETPEPDLSYIFKHIITQEVAYNLMSFAQRSALHQAVAEWIESAYREDLAPYYPLLAYHYRKALGDQYGRTDLAAKTIEYLEKAADRSLDSFANREAARFYGDLLALNDVLGSRSGALQRARWLRGQGEAMFRMGDWEKGGEKLEEALIFLGHPVPTNQAILALKMLMQIPKQAAHRLGDRAAANWRPSARGEGASLETARAYRALTQAYWYSEQLSRFVYAGLYNANLTRRLGLSPELLQAYANLCVTLGSVPGRPFADAYGHLTVEMSRDIDDLSAKAWSFMITGLYYLFSGRWEHASMLLNRACEYSDQIGYRRQWQESWSLLAIMDHRQGRFAESEGIWQDVYASAIRGDVAQPLLWALAGETENVLWTSTNLENAWRYLEEAQRLLAASNLSYNDRIRVHSLTALVHLRQGDDEAARREIERSLELMAQTNFLVPYSYVGYVAPVDVYLTLWESAAGASGNRQQELSQLTRKTLKVARRIGGTFPIFQPRAWNYQGRYEWLAGRKDKARQAWQKSIELARELGMPQEEGLAHYEYGRSLAPGDADRQEQLQQALDLFTQVEANYYLNLADAEIGRSTF